MDTNTHTSPNEPQRPRRWAGGRDIGHLFRLQWPAYVIDILVIILGITISFTLDSRKEEANRLATEQLYLRSLAADIESDILELDKVSWKTRIVVTKASALLSQTDHPQEGNIDTYRMSDDIRAILERPNFTSKDATFSDLRSSGNMQLITDIKLKAGLFEYYRLYESVKAVETAEREAANTIIAPYFMKRFSIKSMIMQEKSTMTKEQWKNILGETEFSNVVTIRLITRQELLDDYRRESDLAKNIKAALGKQIR